MNIIDLKLFTDKIIMKESFKERFTRWICNKFGHKLDINNAWEFEGIHCTCDRCGLIVTKGKM